MTHTSLTQLDAPLTQADAPLTQADADLLASLAARATRHGLDAPSREAGISLLETLEAAANHLDVARTRLIARIDEARGASQKGRTTSAIVSEVRKLPTPAADAVVLAARRHAAYPAILTARAEGRISRPNTQHLFSVVGQLRPFLTPEQFDAAESALIADAEVAMPGPFKRRCRTFLDEIDLSGGRTRAEQDKLAREVSAAKRFLAFYGDSVRGYDIRGHITGDQHRILIRAINAESNRILRARRARGQRVPGEATRAIDALVALAAPKRPAPTERPASPTKERTEDPRARTAGPLLRAKLIERDRGCVVPWCDAPPEFADGHHILAFHDGGPTTLENMCLLCTRHHPEFENPPGSTSGWTIRIEGGIPVAIPPIHVDPRQRPRVHDRFRSPIRGPAPPAA